MTTPAAPFRKCEELVDALDRLVAALETAQTALADPPPIPGDQKSKEANMARAIPNAALNAVDDYLNEVGISSRLRMPILHIIAALADAGEGRPNPILTIANTGRGGVRMGTYEIYRRAAMCEAIVVLRHEKRMTTVLAVQYVATVMSADRQELAGFYSKFKKGLATPGIKETFMKFRAFRKGDGSNIPVDKYLDVVLGKALSNAPAVPSDPEDADTV